MIANRRKLGTDDDVDVETNKLGRNLGVTLGVRLRPAIRDCDGAILDPAKVA
jgi:hypothetical protein